MLEKTKILCKLDILVTTTVGKNYKQNPDTFLEADFGIGLQLEQCVVFEGADLGKQAAHAAQMDCILVMDEDTLEFHSAPD